MEGVIVQDIFTLIYTVSTTNLPRDQLSPLNIFQEFDCLDQISSRGLTVSNKYFAGAQLP